ncbi:MAG: GAF domain-containing protein [Aromatoleum sp.]|jgi:adenylate cyclase|uniref:GAF domain-containing protein n=1 Tax=Aromatoleum sp. TaxID=2307007 RepID=UPI002894F55C|nr:GAF domain-containing protein [Aromatoleum sp.]MDT3672388.1 GAF domain-containing protein [Aromatoleum sp.]
MNVRLDTIRECLEGALPGVMATCSADGAPNVAFLSQAEYVDGRHLALSYQFFNTTRRNILENPHARLIVTHPRTAERYRLLLRYLRTETGGPLFERMKAKLAGVASHSGMGDVFRLLGSDVCRVLEIERVPGPALAPPAPRPSLLAALRLTSARLALCRELDTLLTEALASLESRFGFRHTSVLLLDAAGTRLYTVASRGYESSGVGSEVAVGDGAIGVAAREATPIRIAYLAPAYAHAGASRSSAQPGSADALETRIALPALPEPRSRLAVPIRAFTRLLGVLYAESAQDLRFGYDDEDALVALAGQLGAAMLALRQAGDPDEGRASPEPEPLRPAGPPVVVRHHRGDDSVFLDDEYLIKGVAGAIFWTMMRDLVDAGRSTFNLRELRLDPRIPHGQGSDDLDARLLVLRRRLSECVAALRLESIGSGNFLLTAHRPPTLIDLVG